MKRTQLAQWSVICWLTYFSAYLCRVNFSASLSALSAARGVDYAVLGAAGAAFFVVYAVGQLVNGFIGDHVNPAMFILTALCGTVLCNMGVAFVSSFHAVFIIWALNGYFQSIFWSTIIRVLALTISKERRGSASAAISSAMPAGYLVSWCVLAPCLGQADVKWFFLAPALTAIPMTWMWYRHRLSLPQISSVHLSGEVLRKNVQDLLSLVKGERMVLMLAVCILHGLIKEGVGFWFPTIIRSESGSLLTVTAALALFPAANFAGTQVANKLLVPFADRPRRIVAGCYAAMAPLCVAVLLSKGMWVLAPMCVISALSYCANTVLMSYIPMQYLSKGLVASLVGLLDFCSYLGAALATYVLGGMLNDFGVQGISLVWLAASCTATMMLLLHRRDKKAQ